MGLGIRRYSLQSGDRPTAVVRRALRVTLLCQLLTSHSLWTVGPPVWCTEPAFGHMNFHSFHSLWDVSGLGIGPFYTQSIFLTKCWLRTV